MAPRHPTLAQTYAERSEQPNLTPLATYLYRLIHIKRTNLCVSADVTTTNELLRVAEEVGDHICILKTHADIISDFGEKTIRGLNEISRRKKFLVFEDRKFFDIGNTVQLQYSSGPLSIVRWAPIVNASIHSGAAIIPALAEAAQKAINSHNTSVSTDIRASPRVPPVDDFESEEESEDDGHDANGVHSADEYEEEDSYDRIRKQSVVSVSTTISMKSEAISPQPHIRPSISRVSSTDSSDEGDDPEALNQLGPPPFFRSLLLLAQMSSANNYFTPEYTADCLKHARENKDFVMGFIAQQSLNQAPEDNFITMTPGVQLQAGGDGKGQQYNTPDKVIGQGGTDVIIVGRGIIAAPPGERMKVAIEYRRQGWEAYRNRVKSLRAQRR